jgi:hypothetical protein
MADLNHSISAEYAREILDYNPETGEFRWKVRDNVQGYWNYKYAGKLAGTMQNKGYVQISINYKCFLAHRLAWLITHGEWPPDQIDHRDGDRTNNRINNLRLATNQENIRNSKTKVNNTSGVSGVCFHNRRKKWRARIRANGKRINLGLFGLFEDAVIARKQAEIFYFGEFRRNAA